MAKEMQKDYTNLEQYGGPLTKNIEDGHNVSSPVNPALDARPVIQRMDFNEMSKKSTIAPRNGRPA